MRERKSENVYELWGINMTAQINLPIAFTYDILGRELLTPVLIVVIVKTVVIPNLKYFL